MNRRKFVKNSGQMSMLLALAGLSSFRDQNGIWESPVGNNVAELYPISLAEWSLNKAIRQYKTLSNLDFAKKARELGFNAIEFVNQLYEIDPANKSASIQKLTRELKQRSLDNGVKNVQIMVDNEGLLCALDKKVRDEAITNHIRWIDASVELGCVSTRINLFGDSEKDPARWHDLSVESLTRLSEYAAPSKLNVVVENHGGLSSDGAKLAAVMKAVNKPNCGTLPDFGNFCVRRENGAPWGAPCVEQYDIYQGTADLMPYAKGVSAKTFDFKPDGDEVTIDYHRMGRIIRESGFRGYLGIEYEGEHLGEEEGILATKKLVERIFHT
ncbi:MAG: sugar phosphate isomerase/epimerase family protein [Chitinophagaceae bacterium]